jgi:hypothetical protein
MNAAVEVLVTRVKTIIANLEADVLTPTQGIIELNEVSAYASMLSPIYPEADAVLAKINMTMEFITSLGV